MRSVFYENIINTDTNHKNYDTTLHQSYSTYFNSIGKTYTPCQGVVWSQYKWTGTFMFQSVFLIQWLEFWGPNFYSPFLKYKQHFLWNIINTDTNHKNYDTTLHQSYSTYFNSIGKTYTPCQGVVWSKYKWTGTFMFH